MFGIKAVKFTDESGRLNIDYKNIEEYQEPFVMTLRVNNKRKLDVWNVSNGKEAANIREEYKKLGRNTSYVDFYENIGDLIKYRGEKGLQFKPRLRGKNKSKVYECKSSIEQESYLIPKDLLEAAGITYEELKKLLKDKAIERIKRIYE